MGQVRFAVSAFCVAFVLGACGDDITREVVETVAGEALFESSAEPAGDNCAEGGTALSVGLDRDGDGALSADEIDSTSYLCDAASGATAGSTVVTADEPAGQNCPFGGVAVTTGVDADGDGALSGDEVVDVVYICTPEAGSAPSLALTSTSDEPAGENCAAGGLRIDAGVDADGDGQLGADEVSETTYACFPDNTTGDVLNVEIYLGEATDECPGGFVSQRLGLDANADGVLQEEEQSVSLLLCNAAPAFGATRFVMGDCAEAFTFDPQVTDDGGLPASLSVETLTPGAPTELVVDDRFRVTVPAVESRGGMDVLATATDTFGVETTARLRVIFGGENCSDLGTFYGVDPDSCREVSVGIAGDDRGGAVLSESYVFYNGDDALVRMDLELNDVTVVGPEDTDTLFSDSETFGLYSLWSSEFAFTNVGDHDEELTDLGVFDAFVPVDEETLEVGPAISLEVPVFVDVTSTLDLGEGSIEFFSYNLSVARRGDVVVFGMDGFDEASPTGERYRYYMLVDAVDGSLVSHISFGRSDDVDLWDRTGWRDQENRITALPLLERDGGYWLVYRDRGRTWSEINIETGEANLLSETFAATCDVYNLALNERSLSVYGHAEGGCFVKPDQRFEESMYVCDALLVPNTDGVVDDRGNGGDD